MPLANVWTVRDGKAVRFEVFLDRGQALEHAGLAAPGGIPNRE
jgi:ketosteroid isomerase-like protein